MLKVLKRTLVASFYQQHAGLFLVVFYLIFGAVEGSQILSYQKALLIAVCTSPQLLLILLLVWLLYGLKCIYFINKLLKQQAYSFLQLLTTLPKRCQYQLWLYVYAICFLPILVYSILIVAMAIAQKSYYCATATIIFTVGLMLVAAFDTFNKFNYTYNEPKIYIKLPHIKFSKRYWLWPLYHFLTDQKAALLITKLISLLAFKAILWVFTDVGVEIKVYLTAIFAVVLSHSVLVFNMVKFEANYLGFMNALPMNRWLEVSHQIAVLFILVIPELVIFSWIVNFDAFFTLRAILLSVSTLLFLKVSVIFLKAEMESYMKWLLFYFFVTMLAILSSSDVIFAGITAAVFLTYLVFHSKDVKALV